MKKSLNNLRKLLLIIFLTQFFSISAFSQSFLDLGTLGGLNSEARSISADGSVIVGRSGVLGSSSSFDTTSGGAYSAFLIAKDGKRIEIEGFIGGGNLSSANGVSGDGNLVVGAAYLGGNTKYHPFLYNLSSNEIIDLGVLRTKKDGTNVVVSSELLNSTATAISANGEVIVGRSEVSNGPVKYEAFQYVNGQMTSLGSLTAGGNSQARAVSADGSVIVGSADIISSSSKAFKYSNDVMTDLGNLGDSFSDAYAVSSDGSVIVGESKDSSGNMRAFKYTDTDGMIDLATLGGLTSSARGVSGDGKIIVGQSKIEGDAYQHGFLHVDNKMIDIKTLGGNNSYINAISSDGKVFTGKSDISTSSNTFHAFIAKTASINDIFLVDTTNTVSAIANDASKLNSILNQKSNILNLTLNQDAKLFGRNNLHVSIGTRYANITPNSAQSYAGTLKVAYLFNKYFRAGVYMDQTIDNNLSNNFSIRNSSPTIAAFATLSENQNDKGFKLRLSVARESNNLSIRRSTLDNTEAGQGKSNLTSKGALAELSYGINFNNSFKIEPYSAIRYTAINRNSYNESDSSANFPIAYRSMEKKAKTLLFGSKFAMQLTEKLALRAQLGVENDISSSIDGYSGNISYMGQFNIDAAKIRKNRRNLGIGSTYSINRRQEIGFDLFYNQQSLNRDKGTLAYLYYSIGL
jgi:probable HAF family extracellular repeat protein